MLSLISRHYLRFHAFAISPPLTFSLRHFAAIFAIPFRYFRCISYADYFMPPIFAADTIFARLTPFSFIITLPIIADFAAIDYAIADAAAMLSPFAAIIFADISSTFSPLLRCHYFISLFSIS
jgi:hypothetical protein